MRLRFLIPGLMGLAVAGTGSVFAAIPENLALPLPPGAKVAIASPKPVEFLSGETVPLTQDLHLEIAPQLLTGALRVQDYGPAPASLASLPLAAPAKPATAAALEWDFSKWGSLGLVTQSGAGSPTLLADFAPRPLSFSPQQTSSAAGLSAHVKFGEGWVTSFSYSADVRQLDLRAGASPAFAERSSRGQSYGFSVAKHGVFGDADALGLSVARPSDEYFGSVSLPDAELAGSVNLVNNYRALGFDKAKETDVALGYVTSFFHGALSLQANAGYQMNADGQNGATAVTVLSRAKINF